MAFQQEVFPKIYKSFLFNFLFTSAANQHKSINKDSSDSNQDLYKDRHCIQYIAETKRFISY